MVKKSYVKWLENKTLQNIQSIEFMASVRQSRRYAQMKRLGLNNDQIATLEDVGVDEVENALKSRLKKNTK